MQEENYKGYLIKALAVQDTFGGWLPEFRIWKDGQVIVSQKRRDHSFETVREAEEGALSWGKYWIDKQLKVGKLT